LFTAVIGNAVIWNVCLNFRLICKIFLVGKIILQVGDELIKRF
jgi:hypothetical protein